MAHLLSSRKCAMLHSFKPSHHRVLANALISLKLTQLLGAHMQNTTALTPPLDPQTFDQLALPEQIKKAIKDLKYEHPTDIQAKAIPVAMSKRDLVGCAQTGTGKTAAFLIPIISQLLKSPRKTALILVPTRELAVQVMTMSKALTKYLPEIKAVTVMGGMPMNGEIRQLKSSPRILIATPGRLADHLRRGHASLRTMEILVLDEADRMLDMGFAPQLAEIMRFVPTTRQTFLFSATMPPNIEKLANKYLKGPVRVNAGPIEKPVSTISQQVLNVTSNGGKKEAIKAELKQRQGTVIVFTRTKHRADSLCKFLVDIGHSAARIHGGRTQGQRLKALEGFRAGQFQILVATDLVSRGIDVANIAHVINFDLPRCPEDYIHRIGRTARAGAQGQALSLVAPEERGTWKKISHLMEKTSRQ
jgi:ATP-dependent RNA helicase DeaD